MSKSAKAFVDGLNLGQRDLWCIAVFEDLGACQQGVGNHLVDWLRRNSVLRPQKCATDVLPSVLPISKSAKNTRVFDFQRIPPASIWATLREIVTWLFYWTYSK